MTLHEVKIIARSFSDIPNPSEEERFAAYEAMKYVIEKEKDPDYMLALGGEYCAEKKFDLALKYYELAEEYGCKDAYMPLGYFWYYGRGGIVDYQKAFKYFSAAANDGDITAQYKIADMYKNGYYVKKDYGKYKEIIERLYKILKRKSDSWDPVSDVYVRYAEIRIEEGFADKALKVLYEARDFLMRRLVWNVWFGEVDVMKRIVEDIYGLSQFNYENIMLYDLFYLLKSPCKVTFYFEEDEYEVEAVTTDEGLAVQFDGRFYRTTADFLLKAEIDGEHITTRGMELHDFSYEKYPFEVE